MKLEFDVKRAGFWDLRELVQLNRRCFSYIDAYGWMGCFGLLVSPNLSAYKALVEGEMCGFISGVSYPEREFAMLITVMVDESWRRKGLASLLVERFEEDQDPGRLLCLTVRVNNGSAIQLYQKLGYTIVERRERYYGDGDAYIMHKINQ